MLNFVSFKRINLKLKKLQVKKILYVRIFSYCSSKFFINKHNILNQFCFLVKRKKSKITICFEICYFLQIVFYFCHINLDNNKTRLYLHNQDYNIII